MTATATKMAKKMGFFEMFIEISFAMKKLRPVFYRGLFPTHSLKWHPFPHACICWQDKPQDALLRKIERGSDRALVFAMPTMAFRHK